jgi:hypothetical protein
MTCYDRHFIEEGYQRAGNLPFHYVVPDQSWKGRRCFIVGGGPSLKGFEFERLRGDLTIAINRSLESLDPTIWFSGAPRLVSWILQGELGENLRTKFLRGAGFLKCLVTNLGYCWPANILVLNRRECSFRLSTSMEQGIYLGPAGSGCNSGLGALNLALCLGADPIYLLGFDMIGGPDGRQTWHHQDYPQVESGAVYHDFAKAFEQISTDALGRARVINLNPQSAMKSFPFGEVNEVLSNPGKEK